MVTKLSHFWESNSLFFSSQFSYRRGVAKCDALLTLSYHLQVALDKGMNGRLVQLDFSCIWCGLLYKLRSISVGGQFLFIVSEFLSDGKQRVRLDGKVKDSVDVVSGVPQCLVNTGLGTNLWTMRMILRSMRLFLDLFRILK